MKLLNIVLTLIIAGILSIIGFTIWDMTRESEQCKELREYYEGNTYTKDMTCDELAMFDRGVADMVTDWWEEFEGTHRPKE